MTARLFLAVAGTQARTRVSYRVDFWISAVVTFLVELGLVWFVWTAVFAESGRPEIGGWSLDGMILYSVVAVLLGRLVRGHEIGEGGFSQEIYDGSLSRYLVYPAPYMGIKYAQQVGSQVPALLHLALFGGATALVLHVPPDAPLSPASVAMGLGATAVANLLWFALSWPIQAVAFWADNVWSLAVAQRLVTSLLGGILLPLSVFPEWARGVLDWLPFKWMFAFPIETFLGRVAPADWGVGVLVALAWAAALAGLGALVWRRGRRQYTGVGM